MLKGKENIILFFPINKKPADWVSAGFGYLYNSYQGNGRTRNPSGVSVVSTLSSKTVVKKAKTFIFFSSDAGEL